MMTTTMIDIAELRRLEAEATPAPWDVSGLTVYDTCMDSVASTHSAADAALIVAMRNALPELLKALEEAQDGDLDQILHDPENQPSQYGTVPYEWLLSVRKNLEEIASSGDYGTTGDGHSDCVGLAMDALALLPPHGGVDVG